MVCVSGIRSEFHRANMPVAPSSRVLVVDSLLHVVKEHVGIACDVFTSLQQCVDLHPGVDFTDALSSARDASLSTKRVGTTTSSDGGVFNCSDAAATIDALGVAISAVMRRTGVTLPGWRQSSKIVVTAAYVRVLARHDTPDSEASCVATDGGRAESSTVLAIDSASNVCMLRLTNGVVPFADDNIFSGVLRRRVLLILELATMPIRPKSAGGQKKVSDNVDTLNRLVELYNAMTAPVEMTVRCTASGGNEVAERKKVCVVPDKFVREDLAADVSRVVSMTRVEKAAVTEELNEWLQQVQLARMCTEIDSLRLIKSTAFVQHDIGAPREVSRMSAEAMKASKTNVLEHNLRLIERNTVWTPGGGASPKHVVGYKKYIDNLDTGTCIVRQLSGQAAPSVRNLHKKFEGDSLNSTLCWMETSALASFSDRVRAVKGDAAAELHVRQQILAEYQSHIRSLENEAVHSPEKSEE